MALTVNINNNSPISSSEIYWICFGLDSGGNWSYVSIGNDGKASLKQFSLHQDCGSLFNTIDKLNTFTDLPNMSSGQFLFTYGSLPKTFNIVKGAENGLGVQTPSFTPNSADADTIFNIVEFTYKENTIWCDSTIVDYFCAPVNLKVVGDKTKTNGIMKRGSDRDSIFKQIAALGDPWSKLIMQNESGDNIRVLGPQHGVQQGLISSGIYDSYVDACWANFSSTGGNSLTVNCSTFGTYVGQTDDSNGAFIFKQDGKADVTINKPAPGESYDIFGCVGTLNAPNATPLGQIAAIRSSVESNRSKNEWE